MAKKKNSTESEQVNNEVQSPEEAKQGGVSLAELCDMMNGLSSRIGEVLERVRKLEMKIDAVEKLSARNRNYSAEDIFKVQNPFSK